MILQEKSVDKMAQQSARYFFNYTSNSGSGGGSGGGVSNKEFLSKDRILKPSRNEAKMKKKKKGPVGSTVDDLGLRAYIDQLKTVQGLGKIGKKTISLAPDPNLVWHSHPSASKWDLEDGLVTIETSGYAQSYYFSTKRNSAVLRWVF